MKKLLVSILFCFALGSAGALAGDTKPVGSWEAASGEARYKVTMCGDGTALCAKLTWLRDDLRTDENLRYLNKYVVQNAQAGGNNTWHGTVKVYGETAKGKIKVINAGQMKLTGCLALLCQTMTFNKL